MYFSVPVYPTKIHLVRRLSGAGVNCTLLHAFRKALVVSASNRDGVVLTD